MDFGLQYGVPVPKPWHRHSEYDAFQQVIAQAVQAETSGFSHFWAVEHHFLTEHAHCSAPEVLLGAVAARTKKIRIGHGVRLLPFPYNHPIRTAEMAAMLDLISSGRLEFGTGRSNTRVELEVFGIDPESTRSMWEEALAVVVKAWTEEILQWKGKHFQFPDCNVIPKPLQRPHPPLWVAGMGSESHEIAGRKGLGILSFTIVTPLDELAKRVHLYREGIKQAVPIGHIVNNNVAAFTLVHCAKTDREAKDNSQMAIAGFLKMARKYLGSVVTMLTAKGGLPQSYEYMKDLLGGEAEIPYEILYEFLDENDLIIVGSPEKCIEKIKRYQEIGIDQLLAQMQIWDIPHEKVMESIRLFGEHVIPVFSSLVSETNQRQRVLEPA